MCVFKMFATMLVVVSQILVASQISACAGHRGAPKGEEAQVKEREARASLERLYRQSPEAQRLSSRAAGILVFPEITKAGFVVGGQYGDGVLFKHGRFAGFYNSTSASVGLQAGAQQLGYALFFMSENDLKYLDRSKGWEIGTNPNLTIVDRGYSTALTSTTAREGIYAFFFDQKGLMAGIGLQGTKITKRG
jgi:lipid-binding SYLF domain-containing protein